MVSTIERRVGNWMAEHNTTLLRWALGIVFLWFGVLKFCPGLCDVELLAQRMLQILTLGKIAPALCIRMLAVWECGMGVTLLIAPQDTQWGKLALKICVVSLLVHLAGTLMPLVLFPADTWKHLPYAPTLAGQYILKNLVLLAATISVGASAFGQSARLEVLPAYAKPHQHEPRLMA
jgi:uncharacterized membrane protein YkgB